MCLLRTKNGKPGSTNCGEEMPALLADHRRELDATPVDAQARRERIQWQIRRVEKRMAEVHARLTAAGG